MKRKLLKLPKKLNKPILKYLPKKKRQRREVNKESVLNDLIKIQEECEKSIDSLRKSNAPTSDGLKRKKKSNRSTVFERTK